MLTMVPAFISLRCRERISWLDAPSPSILMTVFRRTDRICRLQSSLVTLPYRATIAASTLRQSATFRAYDAAADRAFCVVMLPYWVFAFISDDFTAILI
ncbi:hypothetical protein AVEN_4063-1 [Araneus ventricosus]|uniref:Uncharacterized protein n=1 Tax=Araneus ventricosus TaxID=182803 RepID=A0A4Y2MBW1_ARAVE|nr:hypothetical protein AVEN_4063-1 [Araneus ventricosus]